MAEPFKNLTEEELILNAQTKYLRGDQTLAILYRLHKLPQKQIQNEGKAQDFILNVKIGDLHNLGQCAASLSNSIQSDDQPSTSTTLILETENRKSFVRLDGDCYSDFVEQKNHCQIGRNDSNLFVMDLSSKFGTYVNGKRLTQNVVHTLKNGDTLSLGVCFNENSPWMLDWGQFWVFKVYEMAEDVLETRNKMTAEALGVGLILTTIFSNLDYSSFKNCRRVCWYWKDVTKTEMRNRSKVRLYLQSPYAFTSRHHFHSPNLEQPKFETFENFGLQNICLEQIIQKIPISETLIKLVDILEKFGPQFKEIEYNLQKDARSILIELLNHCINATSLSFQHKICQDFSGFPIVPSVRKLRFKEKQYNFSNILNLFPNTSEIELYGAPAIFQFFADVTQSQLNRLTTLALYNKHIYKSRTLFSDIGLSQSFKTFPHFRNLSNLKLHRILVKDGAILFGLCSKFKETLRKLDLSLVLDQKEIDLRFPQIKNLSGFTLKVQSQIINSLTISSTFGTECFPNLLKMTLDLQIDPAQMHLQKFFQNNFENWRNAAVRKFSIIFFNNDEKEKFSEMSKEKCVRCFPNAELKFENPLQVKFLPSTHLINISGATSCIRFNV